MSELFENCSGQKALNLPQTGSVDISANALAWQPCGADGFWIKALYENPQSSQRTWLMKVDAGAWSPLHAHTELEQIYVVEGAFYDQEKEYLAGDYIIRAPGAAHTAGSHDGALVILFYTAAA